MLNVTALTDKEYGTNYQERLKNWIISDTEKRTARGRSSHGRKGRRSLKTSQQANPNSNVHVKEVRKDGIVVSGTKAMICGVAASNEIFIVPGSAVRPGKRTRTMRWLRCPSRHRGTHFGRDPQAQ